MGAAEGVTGGSLAAAWQSSFGATGIAKGSTFAAMQSASMGGMGASESIVATGALATTFTSFCSKVDHVGNVTKGIAARAVNWITNATVTVSGVVHDLHPRIHIVNASENIIGIIREEVPTVGQKLKTVADSIVSSVKDVGGWLK